jgi:hypothetical protein
MDICGRDVLLHGEWMKMGYFDSRVELNPVKAQIVDKAWDYLASVHAHLLGKYLIVNVDKLLALIGNWKGYLPEAQ